MTDFGLTAYGFKSILVLQKSRNVFTLIKNFTSSSVLKVYQFHFLNILRTLSHCKLTSFDMLTNLPNFRKNYSASHNNSDIGVIKELLESTYYHPKGRPKYSSNGLRIALLMLYTSHSVNQFLTKTFSPVAI